ncbi:MAG TPA: preprotein translocase subunit SecE [Candidatus Limnocylindrales bacterium]|nr:preprotein translocase subunit SecE [Candidatus Limnocylindrales bacterium]
MADDTETGKGSTSRRLKGSNETIRQRSEKHQLKASAPPKPSKARAFIRGFTAPLRMAGRQIAKLGRFRVFRLIGRILLPYYVRNSWKELRLVTWPNRRTTWRLTYAVITFSIAFGLVVAGVDFVLDKLFKELILK